MGMTNFDLFALVVFGMAVLGLAAWRQIKRVGEKFEREFQQSCEEEKKKARDAADWVEKDYKRTLAMKIDSYNEACNAVDTDQYKHRLNAGIANQAASMEPFCGEGKKS